jgi:Tfp pilus assembly protein PilO
MAVKGTQPKIGVIIVVLLLFAGVCLLYWFFYLKPALAEIGDVRVVNIQLSEEIADLNYKLAQKPDIEQRWSRISQNEGYLLTKIPEAADLPQVLGALEQLVQSSALELDALTAGEFTKKENEDYYFIPITLKVKGPPGELLLLLERLEQFSHMTLTENATIEEDKGLHEMSVNFNLIFIFERQVDAVGSVKGQV